MKHKLRKKAIKRYLQSETQKPIYSGLGRSKIGFSNGSGTIKVEIVAVTLIKPYHGKNWVAMDADVTIDEEIG